MEEAVCWDLAQREQFLWLGLLWEGKEIRGGCYDILRAYLLLQFLALLFSLLFSNIPVFKFRGYSMWILVAVRGEGLCHLPKSTGLLLTLEGEVKAVLGHFSTLSVLSAASTEAVFRFFP